MSAAGFRFILDTSAVLDYARGRSPAVGELIGEAEAEHRLVGVPGLCLASALERISRTGDGAEQVAVARVLPTLPGVRILPLAVTTIETATHFAGGYLGSVKGRTDVACAAFEANEFAAGQADDDAGWDSVFVLTTESAAYADLGVHIPHTVDLTENW